MEYARTWVVKIEDDEMEEVLPGMHMAGRTFRSKRTNLSIPTHLRLECPKRFRLNIGLLRASFFSVLNAVEHLLGDLGALGCPPPQAQSKEGLFRNKNEPGRDTLRDKSAKHTEERQALTLKTLLPRGGPEAKAHWTMGTWTHRITPLIIVRMRHSRAAASTHNCWGNYLESVSGVNN